MVTGACRHEQRQWRATYSASSLAPGKRHACCQEQGPCDSSPHAPSTSGSRACKRGSEAFTMQASGRRARLAASATLLLRCSSVDMLDSSAYASGRAAASEVNSSSAVQLWPARLRSRNSVLLFRQRSPATTCRACAAGRACQACMPVGAPHLACAAQHMHETRGCSSGWPRAAALNPSHGQLPAS